MSEYIKSQKQSFQNIVHMYLKKQFFSVLMNYAFILCVQLGKGYYYETVAYSNPIISLSVILHGMMLHRKFQIINHKLRSILFAVKHFDEIKLGEFLILLTIIHKYFMHTNNMSK